MEIKIFCNNCHEEILRADTETLKTPLIGEMFQVKKDMEWALFSPSDVDKDLICPMCEWAFHENGNVMAAVNGSFVTGSPEVIIPGIVAHGENTPIIQPILMKSREELEKIYPSELIDKVENKVDEALDKFKSEATDVLYGTNEEKVQSEETPINYVNPMSEEANPIVESIESVPEKVPDKPVPFQANKGDWNHNEDIDGSSEMSGKAPPGTVATEPKPQKRAKKRRGWLKKHGK